MLAEFGSVVDAVRASVENALSKGRRLFERAIAIDPDYAMAHA